MAISEKALAITERIYAAYGTDSGIVFGVSSRGAIQAIVQVTLDMVEEDEDGG